MARRKGTKGQTMNYKILHRKHKIEQYDPTRKPKVHSGVQEGWRY